MKAPLHAVCAGSFVTMTAGFAVWALGTLPVWLGAAIVAPLVACAGFVFRASVRPLVAAGAVALPYLAVTIVEVIASAGRSLPLVVALAGGVVFMALLVPVTRNAKAAALSLRR